MKIVKLIRKWTNETCDFRLTQQVSSSWDWSRLWTSMERTTTVTVVQVWSRRRVNARASARLGSGCAWSNTRQRSTPSRRAPMGTWWRPCLARTSSISIRTSHCLSSPIPSGSRSTSPGRWVCRKKSNRQKQRWLLWTRVPVIAPREYEDFIM